MERPLLRQSLEVHGAGSVELVSGSKCGLSGGLRHKRLVGVGVTHDPRRDVDRKAGHVVSPHVDVPDVDPRTDLESLFREMVSYRRNRFQGAGRGGHEREDSVARVLHHPTTVVAYALLDCPIMDVEKVAPLCISFVDGTPRRFDDIGEEDRRNVAQRSERRRAASHELRDLRNQQVDIARTRVDVDPRDHAQR